MDFAGLFGKLNMNRPKDLNYLMTGFQSHLGPVGAAKLLHNFLRLQSFEDMFTLLWDLPAAHHCLIPPDVAFDGKNKAAAELFRTEGNTQYRLGDLEDALKLYNLSIIMAPHPDRTTQLSPHALHVNEEGTAAKPESETYEDEYKTLAMGYANRSAVFMRIKDYDKCLSDIAMALKYGYSGLLKDKLIDRKERCLKEQSASKLTSEKPVISSINAKAACVLADRSPTVPSFSNALEVANSVERGRHIVATRDISPGEVLAVEKSYCSLVKFDETMMRACSVCLMFCDEYIIPCHRCVVAFCSEKCRNKAFEGIHGKECQILPYMLSLEIEDPDVFLALRVVIHTSFITLKEHLSTLQKESKELPPVKLGFDENGIYNSDYRSVYHISAYNSKKRNRQLYDLCHIAFLLVKMLHESKAFFVDCSGNPINPSREDFIVAGTALLYHMGHNSKFFEVCDVKLSPGVPLCNAVNNSVGFALFPSIWLIRHGCNANAAHYNIGGTRVVRSVMSISAGKEITLQFSEGYQSYPLILRKIMLIKRGIKCNCQACEEDWPVEEDLPDLTFKCVKCSEPVPSEDPVPICYPCDINYANYHYKGKKSALVDKFWSNVKLISDAEDRCDDVVEKMSNGKTLTKANFDDVCNYIVALEKHVEIPCQAFCKTRKVMLDLFVNEN